MEGPFRGMWEKEIIVVEKVQEEEEHLMTNADKGHEKTVLIVDSKKKCRVTRSDRLVRALVAVKCTGKCVTKGIKMTNISGGKELDKLVHPNVMRR